MTIPTPIVLYKLEKGHGYWDVTHYPYGGCFRRATGCEVVQVIKDGPVQWANREVRILFPDGRQAVIEKRAVTPE